MKQVVVLGELIAIYSVLQKNVLHLFYIDETGSGAWRTNCYLF